MMIHCRNCFNPIDIGDGFSRLGESFECSECGEDQVLTFEEGYSGEGAFFWEYLDEYAYVRRC